MLALAVARAIEILGEAAARMSPSTRQDHPEVPWSEAVGIRNRLIHAYFSIDHDILWTAATVEVPPPGTNWRDRRKGRRQDRLPPPLPEPRRLLLPRVRPRLGHHAAVHRLALPGHHLVGEFQVEQLQALDLVAQAGGGFELQVGGGGAHLGFEVAQGGLEVVAEERLRSPRPRRRGTVTWSRS